MYRQCTSNSKFSGAIPRRLRLRIIIFIDGGHTIDAAENDYKNWNTKIIKGGILAIHDVFPDPQDGGRPPYEIYKRAISEGHFSEERIEKSLRVLKKLD